MFLKIVFKNLSEFVGICYIMLYRFETSSLNKFHNWYGIESSQLRISHQKKKKYVGL